MSALRIQDNDRDEVIAKLDGEIIRVWPYDGDREQRAAMIAAQGFREGFWEGAERRTNFEPSRGGLSLEDRADIAYQSAREERL